MKKRHPLAQLLLTTPNFMIEIARERLLKEKNDMKKDNSSDVDDIVSDKSTVCERKSKKSRSIFEFDVDYACIQNKHKQAINDWNNLESDEMAKFNNKLSDFLIDRGIGDPRNEKYSRARNSYLIRNEIEARKAGSSRLKSVPLNAINYQTSAIELAESIESIKQIKSIYKLRKYTTGDTKNAGVNEIEARNLRNCFIQGRELYFAGCGSSLMVKPLNHFYSMTAYSYGMIVLNSPIRFSKDTLPGSHGMTYLQDSMQAGFGADNPTGTFSELFCSFPTELIKCNAIEFQQDHTDSIIAFFENTINTSIGTLFSMLPEMADYYSLMTNRKSRVFCLDIVSADDPKTLIWKFIIGDGNTRPAREVVNKSFPKFDISENGGKYEILVPANKSSEIKSLIYSDIHGNLFFIENPFFPILLPEICLHFLINHVYSCIMRYRPDDWGNVILKEVSADTSLLTRHYFSNYERKIVILLLRCVSQYFPTVI